MTDKGNDNIRDDEKKSSGTQPDKQTLHTTDPQEHMKGPVSSTTHNTGHAFETDETKEEAERIRDKNV